MKLPAARVTRWWWVRHAPVRGYDGRLNGRADVAADTSGNQATFRALAAALPPQGRWVVTPLCRTSQTAAAIWAAAGLAAPPQPPLIEPALMEQDFGDWQGLTYDEVQTRRPAEAHRFWVAPATEAPPGGESFAALVARTGAAVERLSAAQPGSDLIAVAHGGTIRAALAHALAIDPEAALRFSVANLSLTRIDAIPLPDNGHAWRIESANVVMG